MKKPIPGRSPSPLPVNLRKFSQIFHLAANFREYLHAQDTRRHSAPLLAARFHTHNGCSAAHPSLLTASHLLRQNQNHLQRASFAEMRVTVQENPTTAQVARAAAASIVPCSDLIVTGRARLRRFCVRRSDLGSAMEEGEYHILDGSVLHSSKT